MPIVVKGTPEEQAIIERWFQEICPGTRINPDTRQVEFTPAPEQDLTPSCCCISNLIRSAFVTTINPVRPDFVVPDSGGRTVRQLGGGATNPLNEGSTLRPRLGMEGRSPAGDGSGSDMFLDITDNGGRGYFVVDDQGNPINDPMFLVLAHELCTGHAYHNIRGTRALTPGTREQQAVEHENQVRRSLRDAAGNPRFSERAGTEGGAVDPEGVVKARPPDRR
ncbi:MAG: hypothetical protein KatS3mg042_0995 [Rhodothermaceae bacterium]|nr:MAG: hypothetical protein KatS3mg042_0995 [Rhodothermaceae bacterium]